MAAAARPAVNQEQRCTKMLRVGAKIYPNTAKDKVEALTGIAKPEPAPAAKPKPTKKVKANA